MNQIEVENIFVSDRPNVIENKIRSFSRLPDGWRYGEGKPISEQVINETLDLIKEAKRLLFFEFEAFPGANGEILVSIFQGNYCLDLIVAQNLSVSASLEAEEEEIYDKDGLSIAAAKETIYDLRRKVWKQSDYFTQRTSVIDATGLPALRSTIQEATLESPLLITSAYGQMTALFVPISENSTKELSGNPQYFGGSIPVYYQATSS